MQQQQRKRLRFSKRDFCIEPGLVWSATKLLMENSHMSGFFSSWTMQSFTGVIPCTGCTAVAQELCAHWGSSLSPPWTDSCSYLRYCPVSVCTPTLPLESASDLLHPCSILVSNRHQTLWDSLGMAPVLVSVLHFSFPGSPCAPQQPLPLDGNQGGNYGLAVQ